MRSQMPNKGLQAGSRHLLLSDWLTKQPQPHLLSTVQCMVNTLSQSCGSRGAHLVSGINSRLFNNASRKRRRARAAISANKNRLCMTFSAWREA